MATEVEISNQDHSESHIKQQGSNNEEIELNLRYISLRDARSVSNFIASHGAQVTLPTLKSPVMIAWAYTNLADLLILLKHHSILDIVDNYRSLLVSLLEMLRSPFPFGGSWLHSLEILVVDNVENDSRHKKKLKLLEQKLKNRDKILRFCLKCFSHDQRKLIMFKQQRKHVKSKLAKVIKKRKAVSDARKSLKFFYPT